ncbi:MAG TPA: PLDc N-terminal domain-containing protein [Nocardioidaceae bacterium]|nr:PLDc N-terminal domain-containing protein [Nocardioidaceae bacterium]
MARVYLVMSLVSLVLCIYCVIRIIQTTDAEIRYLPKFGWLILVLLFPLVGSIAWLAVGNPRKPRPSGNQGSTSSFPEYDRPGRAIATNPDDDEEFLRKVRERAEEQRRKAAEQKKAEEDGGATPPPPADS